MLMSDGPLTCRKSKNREKISTCVSLRSPRRLKQVDSFSQMHKDPFPKITVLIIFEITAVTHIRFTEDEPNMFK